LDPRYWSRSTGSTGPQIRGKGGPGKEIHIPSGHFLGSDRDFMAVILHLPPAYLDFIFFIGNPIRDLAVAQSN
jgi:hypothetical protein